MNVHPSTSLNVNPGADVSVLQLDGPSSLEGVHVTISGKADTGVGLHARGRFRVAQTS